jgi:DNA-directed RNA polymerase subunit beta'
VGVIAAQSIGEPGTQLTMRTFHIGGAASRAAAASQLEGKSAGTIRFLPTIRYITNVKGEPVAISRNGELIIVDDNHRERERHKVPYGATLAVMDGQVVKAGTALANWDPHTRPIITEYAGRVKFENVEDGVTVAKQIDEVTGLSTLIVIDGKRRGSAQSKGVRPQVRLIDADGQDVKVAGTDISVSITFQVGSLITVKDGQEVNVGDVLARIPQETSKTRDITGGLPRVADLFEAAAQGAGPAGGNHSGTISFGKDTKGKQRLVITDMDGVPHEYLISKGKHVTVHDGQVVQKGETIVDGPSRSPRHHAPAGHRGAGALHHRRNPGRLSPAGREDQRQAHRGHGAADAAPRQRPGSGRYRFHPRRAGGAGRGAEENDGPWPKASNPPATSPSCWASPRRPCPPSPSSPRPPSRRPPGC